MRLKHSLNFAGRMKITTKMLSLILVVFLGFLISLGMGYYTINEVKIGSKIYSNIKNSKDSIEQIALLKSDLNQVRAELINLIAETSSDEQQQILGNLQQLTSDINEKFAAITMKMDSEEKKVAVQDAQATWQEFADTMENEQIPAARRANREKARELTKTIQKMRYDRFIEQVGNTVDTLRLEIEERETVTGAVIRQKIILAGGISAALFLIVLFTITVVARSVTKPLRQGVIFAQSVAEGNLSETIEVNSSDEIGELSASLNKMVGSLGNMVNRINASARDLAGVSGNIFQASKTVMETADFQAADIKETALAVQAINTSVAEVAQGVDSLSVSASETSSSILEMAASVEEVAVNMESLVESVEEVSSSIAEIASAIKQISDSASALMDTSTTTASSVSQMDSSIKEIERNSRETAAIAKEVLKDAETGKDSVEATIAGMDEIRSSSLITADVITALSEKAENIGAIIKVIDDLTGQTNLLALNAAIIAAQAGEHGKGFAVVADEIKELAERTKSSTGEITQLIKGVQQETERAVQAIDSAEKSIEEGSLLSRKSGEALEKIVAGVKSSTDRMDTIARAAVEQSGGSRMINEAMEKVSLMVRQIGSATKEQAKASDFIAVTVERMSGFAGQVCISTREQAKVSGTIARSTENITWMINNIKSACAIQSESSNRIVQAVNKIEKSTGKNLDATKILDTAVNFLSDQTGILQKEMDAFRVGSITVTAADPQDNVSGESSYIAV
ncbi:MAG: methyl-accepting chemotaxis [Geobacteraceae bacterium]|nr:MAG: methyl-accepting chemotaxis [Geobacteraceae bacterium]